MFEKMDCKLAEEMYRHVTSNLNKACIVLESELYCFMKN